MSPEDRSRRGFGAGSVIGTLGGLIGLGGAETPPPALVGMFRLPTLEAGILDKAMSLVGIVAVAALLGVAGPLGLIPTQMLMLLLGAILPIPAIKTFRHAR
jgi:hypothetical protein